MVPRRFWLSRVEEAWKRRPVVWLAGVRRAGKTVISQSLPDIHFVVPSRGGSALAIECKWSARALDVAGLRAFRRQHPRGENWLAAQDVDRAFERNEHGLRIECLGIHDFSGRLDRMGSAPPQEKKGS